MSKKGALKTRIEGEKGRLCDTVERTGVVEAGLEQQMQSLEAECRRGFRLARRVHHARPSIKGCSRRPVALRGRGKATASSLPRNTSMGLSPRTADRERSRDRPASSVVRCHRPPSVGGMPNRKGGRPASGRYLVRNRHVSTSTSKGSQLCIPSTTDVSRHSCAEESTIDVSALQAEAFERDATALPGNFPMSSNVEPIRQEDTDCDLPAVRSETARTCSEVLPGRPLSG